MPTPNLGLSTPAHGSNVDTWDADPINLNSNTLDRKFGAVASVGVSSIPVTLSATQYQSAVLRISGTLTSNVSIILPAVSLPYTVENRAGGGFTVSLTTNTGGENIGCPPGGVFDCFTDGTNVRFKNLGQVGDLKWIYSATTPAWITACTIRPYLLCDGSSFSASTYPLLNGWLGSTTLPDLRGRSQFMMDLGANRLTSTTMTPNGSTLGATGGAQTITLDVTMIPAHNHPASITDPGHRHTWAVVGGTPSILTDNAGGNLGSGDIGAGLGFRSPISSYPMDTATTGITASTSNTGGGGAHNNVPPAIVAGLVFIKT